MTTTVKIGEREYEVPDALADEIRSHRRRKFHCHISPGDYLQIERSLDEGFLFVSLFEAGEVCRMRLTPEDFQEMAESAQQLVR